MHEEICIVLAARRTNLKGQCLTKIVSVTDKQFFFFLTLLLTPLITTSEHSYYSLKAFLMAAFRPGEEKYISTSPFWLWLTGIDLKPSKLGVLRNKTKKRSQFWLNQWKCALLISDFERALSLVGKSLVGFFFFSHFLKNLWCLENTFAILTYVVFWKGFYLDSLPKAKPVKVSDLNSLFPVPKMVSHCSTLGLDMPIFATYLERKIVLSWRKQPLLGRGLLLRQSN